MRSGQSHPGLPPHPFEMVERPKPPDPWSHFSVHQEGFHSTCAVAALVSPFAASGRVWEQSLFKVQLVPSADLCPGRPDTTPV